MAYYYRRNTQNAAQNKAQNKAQATNQAKTQGGDATMAQKGNTMKTNASFEAFMKKCFDDYMAQQMPGIVQSEIKTQLDSKEEAQKIAQGAKHKSVHKMTKYQKRGQEIKRCIRKMSKRFGGDMKDSEIISILRCSTNTFAKYRAEVEADIAAERETAEKKIG